MKTLMLIFAFREYGAIDDVDIDLHIDVSFLDVSISLYNMTSTFHVHFIFIERNSVLDYCIAPFHTVAVKVIYED
jgi:hypothetical protein